VSLGVFLLEVRLLLLLAAVEVQLEVVSTGRLHRGRDLPTALVIALVLALAAGVVLVFLVGLFFWVLLDTLQESPIEALGEVVI